METIDNYLKAINLTPEDASAYNNLGVAYSNQNNYEEAISSYKKAIELNSEYASAYYNLGVAYSNQKNYEEAISSYKKAIEFNPEYASAYNNLGNAYSNQNNYEEAISSYKKAIELNSEDASAYNNLGVAYRERSNHEKAIPAFLNSIKSNQNQKTALNNIIELLKKENIYKENIYIVDKFLEQETNLIDKIRILVSIFKHSRLQRKNISLYHYTRLSTIQDLLTPNNKDKDKDKNINLRLYNTEYMNDPEEGAFFSNYLDFDNKEIMDKEISKSFIISLTENKDSIPNWSTYGDDHKGVSIGINVNIENSSSTIDETVTIGENNVFVEEAKLYKVFYYDENKKDEDKLEYILIQKMKEYLDVDREKDLLKEILYEFSKIKYLVKDNDYSYEKEYRIIEHVENYRNAKHDESSPKLFLEFTKFDITKIIFGTKSYKYYEYRPFILKYMNDINKDFGIQDLEISKIKIR